MGTGNRATVVDAWSSENRSRPLITYGDIVPSETELEADSLDQEAWLAEAAGEATTPSTELRRTETSDAGLSRTRGGALVTLAGSREHPSHELESSDSKAAPSVTDVFTAPEVASMAGCPALSASAPGERRVDLNQTAGDLEEFGVMVPGSVPYNGMPHRIPSKSRGHHAEENPSLDHRDGYPTTSETSGLSQSAPSTSSGGLLHALSDNDTISESTRSSVQAPVMSPSLVWRKLEQYFQRAPSAKSHTSESREETIASFRSSRGHSARERPPGSVPPMHDRRMDAGYHGRETNQEAARQSAGTTMDAAKASSQWSELPTSPVTPPIDITSPRRGQTYAQAVGAEIAAEIAASHVRRQYEAQMTGKCKVQPEAQTATAMSEASQRTRGSHLQRAGKATEQYRDLWLYSTGM
ncbi:hypothetical protein CCYA_CCYA10G2982 [Cyanidiococcus yangmingshanensis]|nr:hypothetical protein CCYA_CCYA10G2982 [Cyanidiococcus yangmingshanensis]